jgi:putative transposase
MSDTRYRRNAGSVFCPKYRRKVVVGENADELRSLLYQKAQKLDVTIEALEIMPEHVHLFIESDPTEAPQHLANQFKGYPSRSSRNCAPASLVCRAEAAPLVR